MRLLANLALQNLGRRKARSLLLIAAVAIGSGVVFTGATLMRSIDDSMTVGFTRLGAMLATSITGDTLGVWLPVWSLAALQDSKLPYLSTDLASE